jgi:NodT family efflux transporter outer membrane factor (OMF) lipoprotein
LSTSHLAQYRRFGRPPRPAALALSLAVVAIASPAFTRQRAEPPPPTVPMPAAYTIAVPPGAPLAPAALDQWWRLFGDPTLDALEDEAFRTAPDALTAATRLMEARETRRAQVAATNPMGSITGNASHERAYELGGGGNNLTPVSGVTQQANGNFNVSWELDLFGRLATQRRIARADAAQAQFNVEGIRASLAANVADEYFLAQGLVLQLENSRQTLRIDNDLLRISQRKAAAGAGPTNDVDRVGAQAAQAESQVASLQAQLDDARRQVLILVGRDLRGVDNLALTGVTPDVPAMPHALPAELLARRPDIRQAAYQLQAQLGTAHLAHLAIFPTFTLLPGLGLSSISEPGVGFIPPTTLINQQQTTTTGFWTIAGGVSQPTLDIPKLLFQAKAEDARSRETAIAYENTVRNAFGEAETALTDVVAGEHAVSLLVESEARAHRAYDGVRRGYDQGLDDLTTTLTEEQNWSAIRLALTVRRVQTLRSAVQSYKALGGGWAYASSGAGPGEALSTGGGR